MEKRFEVGLVIDVIGRFRGFEYLLWIWFFVRCFDDGEVRVWVMLFIKVY